MNESKKDRGIMFALPRTSQERKEKEGNGSSLKETCDHRKVLYIF